MKKKVFFDLLYVVLIISLIFFMFWVVNFMKTEASQCMKNPITYFEEKNDGAECYCIKNGIVYGQKEEELRESVEEVERFNRLKNQNYTLNSDNFGGLLD